MGLNNQSEYFLHVEPFDITTNIPGTIVSDKGGNHMQVTCNGFTGELVKLEREDLRAFGVKDRIYNLSIYDSEKQVTHSFTGVKLEDVKFLGGTAVMSGTLNIGEVTFCG